MEEQEEAEDSWLYGSNEQPEDEESKDGLRAENKNAVDGDEKPLGEKSETETVSRNN